VDTEINPHYIVAGFIALLAAIIVSLAINFRVNPEPPTMVNVKALECVDLSSGMYLQDGWKPVHAADEYRVISYKMEGRAEWEWVQSIQCWEAGKPTNRFLINQMWWKPLKKK
jgi:hypothetical protein